MLESNESERAWVSWEYLRGSSKGRSRVHLPLMTLSVYRVCHAKMKSMCGQMQCYHDSQHVCLPSLLLLRCYHHATVGHNVTLLLLGELHTWAPTLHLSRIWSRCRPKKEDWLKKKDRNQRRPGCRRNCCKVGWAPALGPNFVVVLVLVSSCTGPNTSLLSHYHLTLSLLCVGRGWDCPGSSDPDNPTEPAVTLSWSWGGPKTGWRRRIVIKEDLVAEETLAAGELLSRALLPLMVKTVLMPWSRTSFTRSRFLSRAMGVQGQFLRYRAILNKINRLCAYIFLLSNSSGMHITRYPGKIYETKCIF